MSDDLFWQNVFYNTFISIPTTHHEHRGAKHDAHTHQQNYQF